jgi:hypothetical protein
MHLRPQAPALPPVVLGPDAIARIADTLEYVAPVLRQTHYRVRPDGGIDLSDGAGAEALAMLRGAVDEALPADVREQIGQHSGLGWDVFFGHVVGFWLPQQGTLGFLRALVDRAALHGGVLALHWNRDRDVSADRLPAGMTPLIWGGLAGAALGFLLVRWRPSDSILGLLAIAAGLVVGSVVQRTTTRRRCGDRLCRAPLSRRAAVCPSCGARVA